MSNGEIEKQNQFKKQYQRKKMSQPGLI